MLLLIMKSSRSRIPVPAPRGVINDKTLNPSAQGSERTIIAKPFRGFAIALVTAGIMALAFMGLAGMFA